MSGMTPERLAEIRRYLQPTGCCDDKYRLPVEVMASDLLAEVDRLRTQVAAVEASIPEWPLCGYRCAEEIEERVRAALASGDGVQS